MFENLIFKIDCKLKIKNLYHVLTTNKKSPETTRTKKS